MAIYDSDGTANREIGKVYDNNGSVNSQISKVYDNNGSVNSLIYQDRVYVYQNGVLQIGGSFGGNYFRYNDYDRSSNGGIQVFWDRINFWCSGGYHKDFPARAYAAVGAVVDLTPYRVATFDINVGQLYTPNGAVYCNVYYGTGTTTNYGGIGAWLNTLATTQVYSGGRQLVSVNISNVNTLAAFGINSSWGGTGANVSIDCYNIYLE